MPAGRRCFWVAAIAAAMVSGSAANAQGMVCEAPAMGGIVYYGIESPREGLPFTGILKTSFEQKLVDGNTIRSVTRNHQARDSSRRTMVEMAEGCLPGDDGQTHLRLRVSVNDPVARTSMNWEVGSDGQPKVVHVFHQDDTAQRQIRAAKRPEPTPEELEQRKKMMQAAQAQALRLRKEEHIEDLGIKQINGVSAQGTRTTRTIPAGEEGNDMPLVVMNEIWRSREFGLTMMAVRDDPRRGRTTTEYEDFNRGEPDPAVFAPPAGYTVQEQHPIQTIAAVSP
jgi:hypothetical protein